MTECFSEYVYVSVWCYCVCVFINVCMCYMYFCVWMSISVYMCIHVYECLYLCMTMCMYGWLCFYANEYILSMSVFMYMSVSVYVCLCVSWVSVCLCEYFCVNVWARQAGRQGLVPKPDWWCLVPLGASNFLFVLCQACEGCSHSPTPLSVKWQPATYIPVS